MDNKTSSHVAQQFQNVWLCRYPRPLRCVHDNGGKFVRIEFQALLARLGIENVPTLPRNPQANSICERMHQVVGNALRTHLHGHPPSSDLEAKQIMEVSLSTAMFATRATMHTGLETTPGGLVFHCNMVLALPLMADLIAIQQKRQQKVDKELIRQNKKCINHDYKVGEKVLLRIPDPWKLDPRFMGPYSITKIHINGTITIQRTDTIQQRINIRACRLFVPSEEAG